MTQYEVWNRLHARDVAETLGASAEVVLQRLGFLELTPEALRRALEPFPSPVRTLDALHLASAEYLREQGARVTVATYDHRFATAAESLGFALFPL